MKLGGTFKAKLWRYAGPGGWHFVTVPERLAPPVTHGWGRTPVDAVVDGYAWKTSVWRDKKKRTLLAVPKRARHERGWRLRQRDDSVPRAVADRATILGLGEADNAT